MTVSDSVYDRITSVAILVSVVSVFVYDRASAFRLAALLLGALAGMAALGCFIYKRLASAPSEHPVGELVSPAATLREYVDASELRGDYVLVDFKPSATKSEILTDLMWERSVFEAKVSEYTQHVWKRHLRNQWATLSSQGTMLGVAEAADPHAMAEAAAHIANRLASDRLEVVLTPQGQVIVRPCGLAVQAGHSQLEFPEILSNEVPGRPN